MRSIKHTFVAVTAALAAASALAACGDSGGASGDNTELVVAMGHEAPYPGEEAVMFAIPKHLGLFDKYGIDVDYQPTAGSGVAIQLVQSGEADLGQGNPSAVFAAINKGVDISVIYNMIPEYGSGLAVLDDSKITSPKDLKGATIGVASMSSSRLPEAKAMVKEAGLDGDVEYVAVGVGAQAASALKSGKVDGLYLWDAAYKSIELTGTDLRIIKDVFGDSSKLLDIVEYANKDAIEDKGEALGDLGKAGAIAQVWAKDHLDEALDMFYAEFPNSKTDEEGRKRDLKILEFTLKQFDPEGTGQNGYGETPDEKTEATGNFLAQYDLIPQALPAKDYVDNQFVKSYNDFTESDVSQLKPQED